MGCGICGSGGDGRWNRERMSSPNAAVLVGASSVARSNVIPVSLGAPAMSAVFRRYATYDDMPGSGSRQPSGPYQPVQVPKCSLCDKPCTSAQSARPARARRRVPSYQVSTSSGAGSAASQPRMSRAEIGNPPTTARSSPSTVICV